MFRVDIFKQQFLLLPTEESVVRKFFLHFQKKVVFSQMMITRIWHFFRSSDIVSMLVKIVLLISSADWVYPFLFLVILRLSVHSTSWAPKLHKSTLFQNFEKKITDWNTPTYITCYSYSFLLNSFIDRSRLTLRVLADFGRIFGP